MSRNQYEPFDAIPGALGRQQSTEARSSVSMPSRGNLLARVIGAAASCGFLVILSALFVDRPVSTWMHERLGDTQFVLFTARYDAHPLTIGPFTLMATPAEALSRLAPWVVVVLALGIAAGRRWTGRVRIIAVLSLTILVAMEINKELKWAFGRTWPESWLGDNPSWIRDGVFGFFPFHGGSGWGSFPSGHTTAITTAATLLWIVWPKLRILWAALVCIVVAGLIGADYHFVSDVIGGFYLGGAIAIVSAGLFLSPEDRVGASTQDAIGPASLATQERGQDQKTTAPS